MRHAHHLHRIHCGLPLPSPPLCNQSTLALTHTSVESTPQPPTLLTSRPCPSHPQTTPNNNTPPTQLLLSAAQPPSPTTPVPPSAPLSPCAAPPSPLPPYSLPAMWWRVRPPAAHHHSRHHRNVRPRRPQVPSTQSQQRQPHDDAPQQRHTATAAEQRRPHVRPQAPAVAAPQAAITHTPTCMHTHTRHET